MNMEKKKKDRVFDRCAYRCCINTKNTGSRLYRFPKYGDPRHDLWVQYTANPKLKSWSRSSIRCAGLCKDHFDSTCFIPKSDNLRRDAIPRPFFFEALKTATLESDQPEVKVGASRKKICAVLPLITNTVNSVTSETVSTNIDPVLESPNNGEKIVQQKSSCGKSNEITEVNVGASRKNTSAVFSLVTHADKQAINKSARCSPNLKPDVTDLTSSSALERGKKIVQQNLRCSDSKLQSSLIVELESKIRKLEKNKQIFQSRNTLLRKKIQLTREKLDRALEREECRIKITKKLTVEKFLDDSNCTSPLARAMVKMQVHKKKSPYSKDEKKLAKMLFLSSSSTYTQLRKAGCMFPAEITVQNWVSKFNVEPDFCKDIFVKLKVKMMKLSCEERFCELKFDDMTIESYEEYSAKNDIIEGLVDNEEFAGEDEESRNIFVIHLESLNAKKPWRQKLAYLMPGIQMTAKEIDAVVRKCLVKLRGAEAKVMLVTCNLGAANQYLFTSFIDATIERPFVIIDGQKYFISFEFPQLLKKFLSTLHTYEILYCENKPICAYKDFVETYYYYKRNKNSNLLAHITYDHLFPSSFDKMNIKHAFEVLDSRFVTAIRTAGQHPKGLNGTTWKATANFAERINTVINVCNGYKLTRGNADKQLLLDGNPEVETILNQFIEWSSKWTIDKTRKTSKVINVVPNQTKISYLEGFPISVAAVLQTYRAIKEENFSF